MMAAWLKARLVECARGTAVTRDRERSWMLHPATCASGHVRIAAMVRAAQSNCHGLVHMPAETALVLAWRT